VANFEICKIENLKLGFINKPTAEPPTPGEKLIRIRRSCGHVLCIFVIIHYFKKTMEKRIFGVILTILGIVGLLFAGYNFVAANRETHQHIRAEAVSSLLGLLFFFGGIGLIRNTKDLTNRNN
jgi:hypothetical protein